MGMMTVEEACCEILKYLDRIWRSLSPSGQAYCLHPIIVSERKVSIPYKIIDVSCKSRSLNMYMLCAHSTPVTLLSAPRTEDRI